MSSLLINGVTLNLNAESGVNHLNLSLAIPVEISEEDKKLIQKTVDTKGNADLGTIRFSEETSEKVREIAEVMRKELLSQIK